MNSEEFYAPCEEGYCFLEGDEGNACSSPNGFTSVILNGGWVADAIKEQYKQWHCDSPVLIDAPTGSGKTTFICNSLIPELYPEDNSSGLFQTFLNAERIHMDHYSTLLLVSNRAALVRQQKEQVLGAIEPYYGQVSKNCNIDDYKIFDRVGVSSYQGLVTLLTRSQVDSDVNAFLQHLKYVVFDEIHFLYADATFNADASILLTELPKIFRSVIRIYMTATSWSVRNSLLYAEQNAGCGNSTYLPISGQIGEKKLWADPHDHQNSTFYHYQMVGNYDAYRLHFFNRHGDCTDAESYDPDDDPYLEDKDDAKVKKGKNIPALDALINLFPNPSLDRKLLIFVKQKKHGQYLAKYYKEAGIHARFVDSSYRALASEYRKAQAAPKPIKPKVTIYKPGEGEFNTQIAAPERIFDPEELEKIEFWNLFIDKEGDFSKEKKEVKKRYDFAVLIATSVLDCGINIKNEAIRDIVIFADDPTAFMQMLGRKRLPKNCEEKVNLWVYIPPRQNFSTQAQTKQLEIELGEKVLLVQKHTTISKQTQKPDYLRNVFNSNGQFMDAFYAKVESWQTTLHTGALDNELAKKYPGTTHKSIDNELVRNYQRITDKALFHRDPAGHVFCNKYVLWIIRQQLAYYQSFLQEENPLVFRDEVCKWLGRYEEIKKKQDQAKRAIIDFLQKYDGRLIEDTNEIDNLRVLAYNAAQICLDKNPLPYNFKKIYGKTLSKALKLLGIQYTVTSIKGEFHQKTKWLVEVGWKEATE